MPKPVLLPYQIAPVPRDQARLTAGLLLPAREALMEYFQALRAQTDAALAPQMPIYGGKPYPLGRCQEITGHVVQHLQARLNAPVGPVDRLLRGFLRQGGVIRQVWGALRGRYFQNAIQAGGLYIDVSNDTVVPSKPKVEILPLEESGLLAVRDAGHFARVAEAYWQVGIYANHALPGLAPLLPMISWRPGAVPQLQAASDYMTELFRSDGFHQAEAWLADGPPPPAEVVAALLAISPAALHPSGGEDGRAQAIAACRDARRTGKARDMAWRNRLIADYISIPGGDYKV